VSPIPKKNRGAYLRRKKTDRHGVPARRRPSVCGSWKKHPNQESGQLAWRNFGKKERDSKRDVRPLQFPGSRGFVEVRSHPQDSVKSDKPPPMEERHVGPGKLHEIQIPGPTAQSKEVADEGKRVRVRTDQSFQSKRAFPVKERPPLCREEISGESEDPSRHIDPERV